MKATTIAKPLAWRNDEDGIVRFSVRSTGKGASGWRKEFTLSNGYAMRDGADALLASHGITYARGVLYNVAVLRRRHMPLGCNEILTTEDIFAEGKRRGFERLTPEAAFLMRKHLSCADIGNMNFKWIVAMHDPDLVQRGVLLCIPGYEPEARTRAKVLRGIFLNNQGWQRHLGGWAFLVPD